MTTLISILFLVFAASIAYFLATRLIAKVDAKPTAEQARALELQRVELDLRALEHKQRFNPSQYTRIDEEAYAMLIRKRNAMVPQTNVRPAVPRPAARRPVASRLVGGPVRLI
jgi:hypothetical protein